MLRIIAIYGTIAGLIVIGSMILGFVLSGGEGAASSAPFGYLIMLVALTLIFVGMKRHRDSGLGGVIRFGPAFGLGLGIAAVAGVFYVIGWESYLAATGHEFAAQYADAIIEKARLDGADAARLEQLAADMEKFRRQYANPAFRVPMTFLEIFPVGAAVALVSALILRNPKAFPARAAVGEGSVKQG